MTTTLVPTTIPISVAAERLGVHENTVRNWIDQGLLDGYRTPTGRRKLRLDSVERLEREMFGVPSSVVEINEFHETPPQSDQPREYVQGKLP
jgi:excisionase family DNA binding protein